MAEVPEKRLKEDWGFALPFPLTMPPRFEIERSRGATLLSALRVLTG